eukprot:1151108-Pelagomonas_calceolata.AAC.1
MWSCGPFWGDLRPKRFGQIRRILAGSNIFSNLGVPLRKRTALIIHTIRLPTSKFRPRGIWLAEKEDRYSNEKGSKMQAERLDFQAFNSKQGQAQSACQLSNAVPTSLLCFEKK